MAFHILEGPSPSCGNIYLSNDSIINNFSFTEFKIGALLSLNTDYDFSAEYFQFNLIIPLSESQIDNLEQFADNIFKFLNKYISITNILIICKTGKTLGPTVIISYLMKIINKDINFCFNIVKSVCPEINGSIKELKFLKKLEKFNAIEQLKAFKPNQNPHLLKKNKKNKAENKENLKINENEVNETQKKLSFEKENKLFRNIESKYEVHSIESYSKQEPSIYFEDIHCILNPVNSSKIPFQELSSNNNSFFLENIGGLYLSNYIAAKNENLLKSLNIGAVLTVAEEIKFQYKEDIINENICAKDFEDYNIFQNFEKCFNFIDKYRKKTNVLVHCYAGVSRSATIIIGYIMKNEKKKFIDVFNMVRKIRKQVSPNMGFVYQLKNYEQEIFNYIENK